MSGRSGGRDKKGAKGQTEKQSVGSAVTQKTKPPDRQENPGKPPQATAEQIRIAHMLHDSKRNDIPDIDERIEQVMELTRSTMDEASIALNDCDFDIQIAINSLLEGNTQGEWKTSTRKARKPPPQQSTATPTTEAKPPENRTPDGESGGDKENKPENYGNKSTRDRSNNYRGPPRLRRGGGGGGGDKRWRSRERQENEKNLAESGEGGRGRGRGRRDRGQRGRGPRMFQNRQRFDNTEFPQSIDTWNNSQINNMEPFTTGSWDDTLAAPTTEEVWDNDDFTTDGAIESKVFTPSQGGLAETPPDPLGSALAASVSVSLSQSIDLSKLLQKPAQPTTLLTNSEEYKPTAQDVFNSQATESLKAAIGVGQSTSSFGGNSTYSSNNREFSSSSYGTNSGYSGAFSNTSQYSAMHSDFVGPPSSAVTQSYSSSGTSQHAFSSASYTNANTQAYPTTSSSYSCSVSSQTSQSLPPRKQPKSRISSSKIPSEAVEMPHDCVAELGMKLEGIAFGTSTFNDIPVEPSFPSTTTPTAVVTTSPEVNYSSSLTQQLSAARSQSTKIVTGADTGITSFSGQSCTDSKTDRNTPSYAATSTSPKPSDTLGGYPVSQSSPFQSSYSPQKPAGYVSSTYSPGSQSQSSSSSGYPTANSSYSAQQQPGAYPNTQQQSSYTTSSSYTSAYPVTTTQSYSSSYQTSSGVTYQQPQAYQSSATQSAGGYPNVSQSYSTGLSSQYSSGYPPPTTAALLSATNSKLNNALTKDVQYDATGSTSQTGNVSASLGFPSSATTQSTKAITTTSKASNMPGVASVPAALVGTPHPFVVGQTGLHFAPYAPAPLQQSLVQYEEMGLIHQATATPRLPVQATSRDTSLTFSMNDSVGGMKFSGRGVSGDTSTSSPVQTTTPQTQHQFISPFPPAYLYYGGMVTPGSFPQYASTSVYPVNNMVPSASNTHSANVSNAQFQKTVTPATGGGYVHFNSYTDSQDYGKSKNNVSQQPTPQQASDITSMYNNRKMASLDKASYQGIGTPPPFPAGSSYATPVFFPTAMPNQQHHQIMHQLQPDSSTGSGQRTTGTGQSKPSTKPQYQNFWG